MSDKLDKETLKAHLALVRNFCECMDIKSIKVEITTTAGKVCWLQAKAKVEGEE